jgi:hypothetical protein
MIGKWSSECPGFMFLGRLGYPCSWGRRVKSTLVPGKATSKPGQGLERSEISLGYPAMGTVFAVHRRCDALGDSIGIGGN